MQLALALTLALVPPPASAACRLALALALDVSRSVDEEEYQLQTGGLAEALGDPDVRAALFAFPEAPVSLAIYEWSSEHYQRLILDWTPVGTEAELAAVRARLGGWKRQPAPESTGIGAALVYGAGLIGRGPDCWDRTLDVSSDGENNSGPVPERVRAEGRTAGFRINALVVGNPYEERAVLSWNGEAQLTAYFKANVIQGPDAFVEVAYGYRNFAAAMQRKLMREIGGRPIGGLPPLPPAGRAGDRLARQ